MNIIDYLANLNPTQLLTPLIPNNIKYIILHHPEAYNASPDDINAWHKNNGWICAGYNYYIRKDGSIYSLRGSNVGSHCQGFNSISFGVCCEGNYHNSDKQQIDYSMSDVQFNSLIDLLLDFKKWYPNIQIVGHKELQASACPGDYFPLEEAKSLQYRNQKEVIDVNYIDIINKISDNPEKWFKAIDAIKSINGNLGDLEILKYVPELLEKAVESK